jgi:hypothetical protein
MIARHASLTLISLDLLLVAGLDSNECFEVLETFFDRCEGIRNLSSCVFLILGIILILSPKL